LALDDQVTVPDPVALEGVQVNQLVLLLAAVHAQVELEQVTVKVPLLAAEPELALVDEMVYEQASKVVALDGPA
jgi:hypothetical protein